MKNYLVPGNMAATVVNNLPEKYKNSAHMRVAAVGTSQISVYGDPEIHFELQKIFADQVPPLTTEVVSLSLIDVIKLGDTLKNIYGGDGRQGTVYIEAQPDRNVIVVRGTPEQVKEVKDTIQAIERNPAASTGNLLIFSVDKGSGLSLAEVLQDVLQRWQPDHPVEIRGGPGNIRMNEPPKPPPAKPMLPSSGGQSYPWGRKDQTGGPSAIRIRTAIF